MDKLAYYRVSLLIVAASTDTPTPLSGIHERQEVA